MAVRSVSTRLAAAVARTMLHVGCTGYRVRGWFVRTDRTVGLGTGLSCPLTMVLQVSGQFALSVSIPQVPASPVRSGTQRARTSVRTTGVLLLGCRHPSVGRMLRVAAVSDRRGRLLYADRAVGLAWHGWRS